MGALDLRGCACLLVCSVALAGCDKVPERRFQRTIGPAGDQPATTFGDYEPEVLAGALHGEWVVERGERKLFEFSIHGESAKVVDHRYATPRTVEGELVLRSATGFGIEPPDGVTYFYSFVDSGEQVYMGMGTAIATSRNGTFKAKLGAWETLTFDGESCRYDRAFGGDADTEEIQCGFKDKKKPRAKKKKPKAKTKTNGKGEKKDEADPPEPPAERVFTYKAEDPFRPGKKKTFELVVAGDYLISRELADSKARAIPWADKAAAAVAPPTVDASSGPPEADAGPGPDPVGDVTE